MSLDSSQHIWIRKRLQMKGILIHAQPFTHNNHSWKARHSWGNVYVAFRYRIHLELLTLQNTVFALYISVFFSLRRDQLGKWAQDKRSQIDKVMSHALQKKKKRKKARVIKLIKYIKYINCDRQVQFLKRLRPVQVCNRATLSNLDLLNGDCFKISLASSPFFNRREKFKFQLKIAYW